MLRHVIKVFVLIGMTSCSDSEPQSDSNLLDDSEDRAVLLANKWRVENNDTDADGDGLSDFQERYKYLTNPNNPDSDGDGIVDSDWAERREFTYSVYSKMEILKPIDLHAMNSDYQDARIISESDKTVVVEVIHYPINRNNEDIGENPNWRTEYQSMTKYLEPSRTANWDNEMRQELLQELSAQGIDPNNMTDKELVEQVTGWLFSNFSSDAPFTAYFADFGDEITLNPALRERFRQENSEIDLADEQAVLELGVLGKKLFRARKYGSCTPSAILLTTVFRALGLPTRIVLEIPPADGNDFSQIESVGRKIKHNKVRMIMLDGLKGSRGWVSHTYNEVFVGNRWVKLNYATLGQNTLDANFFGLMTQVNTLVDWSDAGLTSTWGMRIADGMAGRLDPPMSSLNQYMTHETSDMFGQHSSRDNPDYDWHKYLTVDKALWRNDLSLPEFMRDNFQSENVQFVIGVKENIPFLTYRQYREFLDNAPKNLKLVATGSRPDVSATLTNEYITYDITNPNGIRMFAIAIDDAELAQMEKGIPYRVVFSNDNGGLEWRTDGLLEITRPE